MRQHSFENGYPPLFEVGNGHNVLCIDLNVALMAAAGKGLNCYEGSHKQFDSWCDHGCLICALIPDGKHHPTFTSIPRVSYEEGSVIDIAIVEQFVHQTQGLLTYVATGSLAEDSTDCSCFRSSAIELYLLNCLRGGGHVTNLMGN